MLVLMTGFFGSWVNPCTSGRSAPGNVSCEEMIRQWDNHSEVARRLQETEDRIIKEDEAVEADI